MRWLSRFIGCLVWAGLLGAAGGASAATLIFAPLDNLKGWTVRTLGPAEVRIVPSPQETACVELRSQGGTVFLTTEVPRESVAGCRLDLSCLVKTENVVRGPTVMAAAKLHMALETPRGVKHYSTRFTGSNAWHEEGLVADVPGDVRRAVLSIGLEACSGRVSFADLALRNDRPGVWPLPLGSAANATRRQLGLTGLPRVVQWHGIPFHIIEGAAGDNDCVRLRGIGHDDWPAAMAPISVGRYATAVYFLHAALEGRPSAESPCTLWNARLMGGLDAGLSVFEGREIGAMGASQDLENWKLAWQAPRASGRAVTLGVTRWPMFLDVPVLSLDCRAYQGAAVVILAATAVEEPAAKPGKSGDDSGESEQ